MTFGFRFGLGIIGALWLSAACAIEIKIDQAVYFNGWFLIRGEIVPKALSQSVSLNRKFTASSDEHGRFAFRVPHLPFLCIATVRLGDVEASRKVDNCVMDDTRMLETPELQLRPRR